MPEGDYLFMTTAPADLKDISGIPGDADGRYRLAIGLLGTALARLAAGYEANAADRQDLLQNIHLQVWRSMASFDGRCSLKTWVYRVAHNVAADHVAMQRRQGGTISLGDPDGTRVEERVESHESVVSDRLALEQIHGLLHQMVPIDRQVMLLYLEDESAATIAEVSGLSAGAVATRIHRLKRYLASVFGTEAGS